MSSGAETVTPGTTLGRALTFFSVVYAGSLAASAVTVANTVLPQMQGDLSAGIDQISWVVTASVVAGAIATPTTPWLATRFGAKQLFLMAILLFTVASVMVGLSGSLTEVVVWRIVQAATGAPIMALSQTFTLRTYRGKQRGPALAIWAIGLTLAWVLSPVFGAYMAEHHSWRFVFIGLAPFGLVGIVICTWFVPATERDAELRFDWLGFISLSVALCSLQFLLNRGQRLDWFESAEILLWAVVGAGALYVLVVHTVTTDKPFFRWQVFRDRNLAVGLVLTFAFSFVSLTPLVMIPTMLESLRGVEPLTIGYMLIPEGIAELIGLILVAPLIGRVDSRLLIVTGFLSYALGAWMMAQYNLQIGTQDVIVPLAIQGAALSFMWLPVFQMLYLTLAEEFQTEAASLVGLAFNLASSTGIAVSINLLTRTAQTSNEQLIANVVPTNELLRFPQYSAWDLGAQEGLASIQAEVAQQALMIGYVNVYWMLMWVCLAVVPVVLIFAGNGRAK